MAYLKQRLETLLGHHVQIHMDKDDPDGWGAGSGNLVEAGEDYVGIDLPGRGDWAGLYLILIAHVTYIKHSPQHCTACP